MAEKTTLAKYHNGNYDVAIFKDGTKIRYNNLDNLTPSFAESIDCTITTKCDGGCPYCYLGCNENGEHADLNQPFFNTLHKGQELALNGNDLTHPDLVKFLARMKNVMRRCQRTLPLLQCGNVVIDSAKGVVLKNGTEIVLSALEYRLLLVFFSNKNQLLSRDRLAEELWSLTKEFVSDNTLSVYIRRLRERIEDDPHDPHLIITVRGLGYKAVDG